MDCIISNTENVHELYLKMDTTNVCRSCMKEVAMWEIGTDPKTMEMFSFCTNIDISLSELPQQFCSQCSDTIQSCCTFITTAREVDLKLKEAISVKVTIKPEINENSPITFPNFTDAKETEDSDCFDDINDNIALSEIKIEKDSKTKKRKTSKIKALKRIKKESKVKHNKNYVKIKSTAKLKITNENVIANTEKSNSEPDLICPFCGKVFAKKRSALRKHILEHLKHTKMERNENTVYSDDLKRKKEPINPNRHYCDTCNRSYAKRSTLEKHIKIFHSSDLMIKSKSTELSDDINFCSMCDKSFESKIDLVDHLEAAHLRYPCPHCSETFSNPGQLYSHKMQFHRGRRFDCPHCDQTFPKRRLYSLHVKTHVAEVALQQQRMLELRYTCDYCSKSFHFKSDLRHHLHMHDSSLKHELCDICGSRFSYKQALLAHRRVHTGEKPFTCATCGHASASASNMRRHVRAHRGERQHQCQVCGKAFNDTSGLKNHMNWHTGERPYKCPHCDKAYMNSSKRKNHLVRAHGFDPGDVPRLAMDGGVPRRYVTNQYTTKHTTTNCTEQRIKNQSINHNFISRLSTV